METIKEGNTMIKTGVKADLNRTPTLVIPQHVWKIEDEAENGCSPDHHIQQQQRLENILRKLHLCMAVFGIHYMNTKRLPCCRGQRQNTIISNGFPSIIYNIVTLIGIWSYCIKLLLGFFVNESQDMTIMRIAPAVWTFQLAINATIMIKASHPRFGHLRRAFRDWSETVLPLITELNIKIKTETLRRRVTVGLVIGLVFIFINVFNISFLIFYPYTTLHGVLQSILISPLPINVYSKVSLVVINVFFAAAWILPMVYVVIMSSVMKYAFTVCKGAFKQALSEGEKANVYPGCLYRQRRLHLNLCKIVDSLDKDLHYFFANWFISNISTACFILHVILKTQMDIWTSFLFIFWLLTCILPMAITMLFAASMNKAAHSPLEHIYDVGLQGISQDQIGQLQLLLSKLTANQVGFTVLNFVTITKELVLTIGGLYLTYFFLLLQF